MKVAFMIMAHNQPGHLQRLISRLNADWAYFFIHIDQKADINAFKHIEELFPNAVLLRREERQKVYWAGFSQVKATLSLLKKAYADEAKFSRFVLLSGVDYPIKTPEFIHQRLCEELEFIRIDRLLTCSSHNYSRYVDRYHFMDFPHQKLIRKFKPMREVYQNRSLYHGSSWWGLSRSAITYIFDYLNKHPDYSKFFKFTRSSDEIFFHSLLKNSPFEEFIVQDFEKQTDQKAFLDSSEHALTYIDWHSKNHGLPRVLQEDDFESLALSGCLLARKFIDPYSQELIKCIDQSLLLVPDLLHSAKL